jgi:AcrR family transcriptional regulator
MARRPARRSTPSERSSVPSERRSAPTEPPRSDREKIIAALLALLAEESMERIGLADIANEAGVSLGRLRQEFPGKLAIYAAHLKAIDCAVLAEDFSDMADEPPRERLFDVLMRRLDKMAPHREAVRSLLRSAGRNPPLALALNGLAARSAQWMLSAADINFSGPLGAVRAQGLAVLFGSVIRTWLNDDDPGLARTMAALDRALARGQRFSGFLDDLCTIPRAFCRLRPRRRRGRRRDDDAEEAEAA